MAPATSANRDAVSLAARRREKENARRRLRLLRLVVAGGVLVFLGFLTWLLFFSSVFAFSEEELVIEGAQSGPIDERIGEQVALVTAPLGGSPLLRISPKEVEKQLEPSPFVLDSKVQRKWPTGLKVTVWEREPALAQKSAEGYQLIGADAVVIETVSEVPEGLPRVSLSALGESGAGSQAEAALEVWGGLSAEARAGTSLLRVDGSQITLEMFSGARVVWGDESDSPLKGQLLEVLLTDQGVGTYDVSDPTRPSTR